MCIRDRVRSPFNINSLAQAAAAAAIGDEAHREASRAMNEEGKRFLYGKLKELGVPYLSLIHISAWCAICGWEPFPWEAFPWAEPWRCAT